jgi:hypothetical protein
MRRKILQKYLRYFYIIFPYFVVHITQAANYDLQVPIGGQTSVSGPSQYIQVIFRFGLTIVGIAALTALVIGGFLYLSSAGSETRKTSGKEWMWGAVIGLALMLCSWLILYTINPQITSLSEPALMPITLQPDPHLGLGGSGSVQTTWSGTGGVTSMAAYSNTDIQAAVKAAHAAYPNVPEEMIWAVMRQESQGDNGAVSPKGATGLMQLMPGTAKWLGVTDINDPGQNIMGGTKYLSMYYTKYGNWTDTLGAYNAGENRVSQYGGGANIPFKETQDYLTSIKNKVPQYF